MRGDVPAEAMASSTLAPVPPLARGCPPVAGAGGGGDDGSPACAGMSRSDCRREHPRNRFPRLRGDVPSWMWGCLCVPPVPPLARGCPFVESVRQVSDDGSPACAGMSLHPPLAPVQRSGFPRLRGDVPQGEGHPCCRALVPPLARGCPCWCFWRVGGSGGSPACAGMSLAHLAPSPVNSGFPRLRGDVPSYESVEIVRRAVPPLARGCPPNQSPLNGPKSGSPACAGMSPGRPPRRRTARGFPRLRGDVPSKASFAASTAPVPPLARGWTP